MRVTATPTRRLALAAFLFGLPVLAHSPAVWEGRLLGPGDGATLHYPLRSLVWEAYRRGELPSWNGALFSGTPLVSSYPAAALFPLMPVLALLPAFPAFQALVLVSLGATGVLTFFYAQRLGAGGLGAYFCGLAFALGPYLLDHLGDTATVGAAPALLLVLLAAEAHLERGSPARAAALAAATALLLLAGSGEATQAGAAFLTGRLGLAYLLPGSRLPPPPRSTLLALVAGLLLAAPQLLPTVLALEAAPPAQGSSAAASVTGLVLRYVSHTPAPALALAALPFLAGRATARSLGLALAVSLLLPGGRGLVLELALAVLAGLALDAMWAARREALGRQLRASFLVTCLAAAAALSIAAAVVAPLPQLLAGSVGVLALALILFFLAAEARDPLKAGVFLLPLTVSFLLQPHGRDIWTKAPLRSVLERGTPTREAVDRALGPRRGERLLTLVRHPPAPEEALDLAYGGLGALAGRRTANGNDPFVSRLRLSAYDGMSTAGLLPDRFLRSDPARLRVLGVRWVQVPVSALTAAPDAAGMGEPLDLVLERGRPRLFPLPITPATELRLLTSLADAVSVPQGEPVAQIVLRLASGHELPLPLRAGIHTAEWSYERGDVRPRVRHDRAEVLESFREKGGFEGHRYRAVIRLPGRYVLDGLRVEKLPGPGQLALWRLGLFDALTGRPTAVSLSSGYLSDTLLFREAGATPRVRLFEVRGTFGAARVVDGLRTPPDEAAVLETLRSPTRAGLDPRREALVPATEARNMDLPADSRASRAELVRAEGNRLDLLAMGPGLLVITEGWDAGWEAEVDGQPAAVVRVNATLMGIVLEGGSHFVTLRHRARGLLPGFGLAAAALLVLLLGQRRRI